MIAELKYPLSEALSRSRPDAQRRIPVFVWRQAALLFLALSALYWATATHTNTFDAVAYANQIGLAAQTGTVRALFHPHHLLFNALGYGVWRLALVCGYGGGPLIVLQRINAVVGSVGVTLFFLALRRRVPRRVARAATALLAFSFGWWICATDGRVNMISTVLLLASFVLLWHCLHAPTLARAAMCGMMSGAAVLFHESAGLFVLVGLAGMAMSAKKQRGKLILGYGGAWAATVLLPYAFVAGVCLHLHSLGGVRHWASAYAESGQWWDFHIGRNLRLDVFGLRHALFVEPPGRAALGLNGQLPWVARLWRSVVLVVLWLLYAGALVGWLVALAGLAWSLPRLTRSPSRNIVTLCLLWIGLYGAFFTVWCPGYFVFWTPALIPLIVLMALALKQGQQRWRGVFLWRLAATWIAVCGAVNLTCSIGPHLRPGWTLWQRVAADARAHTGPRDLLVLAGAGEDSQCEVDIPYFAHRACLSVHETLNGMQGDMAGAPVVLQARITEALLAGRHVYAYGETWADPATVRDLTRHHPGLTDTEIAALFAPFRHVPAWISPRGPVWRLRLMHPPVKASLIAAPGPAPSSAPSPRRQAADPLPHGGEG